MHDFDDQRLAASLRSALASKGYRQPTPIQTAAIPVILEGHDLIGCAQTGTGKTAAFALPALQHLLTHPRTDQRRRVRVLVVAPTRELADQILTGFRAYAGGSDVRCAAVFGGVGMQPQRDALRRGVDVLVACPGRLLDLMGQNAVDLSAVEILVLDEADRMLDMGFVPDIRRIVAKVPKRRQTLLFSATMPPAIAKLAEDFMDRPQRVSVAPQSTAAETVDQAVFHVERPLKTAVLHDLLQREGVDKAVVFTRTKHGADRLARKLDRGGIACAAIHGDKSQGARTRAMDGFRDGTITVLVASDLAARGIDVQGISHVVNFDLPREGETYVHRIGRCGRAGAAGTAWSLCAAEERPFLATIERTLGRRIAVHTAPRVETPTAPPPPARPPAASRPAPRGEGAPRSQGQRRRRPGGRNQRR